MTHTCACNFTFTFGWNRFCGFGFFGAAKKRA